MTDDLRALPADLLAALIAARDRTDAEIAALIRWHMAEHELAEMAVAMLIEQLRKSGPVPAKEPSLVFVGGDRRG